MFNNSNNNNNNNNRSKRSFSFNYIVCSGISNNPQSLEESLPRRCSESNGADSRQVEGPFRKLENSYSGSLDTSNNKGLSDSFFINPNSKSASSSTSFKGRGNVSGGPRGPRDIKQRAIELVELCQSQFLSSLFLVEKKEAGCFRPVINLKSLNQYIPYEHFKMESLSLLKDILQPGDIMCKVDSKDAYFAVPLSKNSSKHVRFLWREKLYIQALQFICLCFGLGPAPIVFTKLLKVPITLLRRLNIRLIIFLDNILLMAASIEQLFMNRDTLIFLLQHLGFVINAKKSVFLPSQRIEFLGMMIDSDSH